MKELYTSFEFNVEDEEGKFHEQIHLKFNNLEIFSGNLTQKMPDEENFEKVFIKNKKLQKIEAIEINSSYVRWLFSKQLNGEFFPSVKTIFSKFFDAAELKEIVLPEKTENLSFSHPIDLNILNNLTNLKFLKLFEHNISTSENGFHSALSKLVNLKFLVFPFKMTEEQIEKKPFFDYHFISNLNKIEYLDISCHPINQQNFSDVFTILSSSLSSSSSLNKNDFSFLSFLNISDCEYITDISCLSKLPNLKRLVSCNLKNLNKIFDKFDSLVSWDLGSSNFCSLFLDIIGRSSFASLSTLIVRYFSDKIEQKLFDYFLSFPSLRHFELHCKNFFIKKIIIK